MYFYGGTRPLPHASNADLHRRVATLPRVMHVKKYVSRIQTTGTPTLPHGHTEMLE